MPKPATLPTIAFDGEDNREGHDRRTQSAARSRLRRALTDRKMFHGTNGGKSACLRAPHCMSTAPRTASRARTHSAAMRSAPCANCANNSGTRPSSSSERGGPFTSSTTVSRVVRVPPAILEIEDTSDAMLRQLIAAQVGRLVARVLYLLRAGRKCQPAPFRKSRVENFIESRPAPFCQALDQSDAAAAREFPIFFSENRRWAGCDRSRPSHRMVGGLMVDACGGHRLEPEPETKPQTPGRLPRRCWAARADYEHNSLISD
jgi:hypothetical protein